MNVVYCSECGFQNPEAANYCSRCGALLSKGEASAETTQTFSADEVGERLDHEDLGLEGPALVVRAGGGRAGESFKPVGERTRIGRSPDCEIFLDDVTVSRNHAVLIERDGGVRGRGPGLAERDVREPQAHRVRAARRRRRAADRQVPDDVHRMTTAARRQPQREKLLRIGEVVRRLVEEFPDISISKIRYLEDEGLMAPRRTQGGYRLFSEDDLERLKTILRMQREEFLPLRVIKDELDAPGNKERKRRRPAPLGTRRRDDHARRTLRTRRRHARAREGARGVRLALSARERRRQALPRVGHRCRRHVRATRALRRRAAPPADVPHRCRTRGLAARPARRAVASRAQQRSPHAGAARAATARRAREELSSLLFWRDLRDLAAQ